eukprot:5773-Heterococcus_DN1.PRE.8
MLCSLTPTRNAFLTCANCQDSVHSGSAEKVYNWASGTYARSSTQRLLDGRLLSTESSSLVGADFYSAVCLAAPVP